MRALLVPGAVRTVRVAGLGLLLEGAGDLVSRL